MSNKTTPRNRNESEIAEYRDALNVVHESFEYMVERKELEKIGRGKNTCYYRVK